MVLARPVPAAVEAALDTLRAYAAGNPAGLGAVAALRDLILPPAPSVPAAVTAALDTLWTYADGDPVAQQAIVRVKLALGLQA
jgi:hypothetical protein